MTSTYLYSVSLDKYYIGHTSDLQERLRRHNSRITLYSCGLIKLSCNLIVD
ncbi:MAG TPA: hypothetical protein DCG75_07970 [Bacteroidales bacterium]|nr:hypothetical protein [Bacteroidales bacterium]